MDMTSILTPLINEAVRDFGAWTAVPVALGVIVFEVRRKLTAKDEEISMLRREIQDLQNKRLHDAREMIRIAESGAAATASRTQAEQRFADLLETLLRRQAVPSLFGWRR